MENARVHRFDTLFVRDRGLRFRYFHEDGRPKLIVWAIGDEVRLWSYGELGSRNRSLQEEMYAFRGVTSWSSWVISQLLFGAPLPPKPTCDVLYEGTYFASCAPCPNVTFRCPPNANTTVTLSIDLRSDTMRRYFFRVEAEGEERRSETRDPLVTIFGEASADLVSGGLEAMILYDSPECDGNEAELLEELQRRPW